MWFKLLVLSLSFVLVSCVGTVEDAKVKLNDLFAENKDVLTFPGLEEARPISHNKVELEFSPVTAGDPNFKYLLYINNAVNPIEINPDSLDKAASGRVRYLVDHLSINTKYKFRLRLKNMATDVTSKNERELTATTFDNKTADFKGITSVSKVYGQSSTTVRIDWVSAIMEGSTTTGPWDPLYYEITIIGNGGIANINNNAYTGTDRKKIRIPPSPDKLSPFNYTNYTNTVIGSLEPDTQYYVQVRAVNKLYDDLLNDPNVTVIPVDREQNTKFLAIKTDPATGNFDWNVDSLKVNPGAGALAKTRVTATWIPASGNYVGYRLFYIKCTGAQCNTKDEVDGQELLTENVMDDIVASGVTNAGYVATNVLTSPTTSYVLTGLEPYKWYQFKLVACRTTTCSRASGDAIISNMRSVRTAPILSPFSGITTVKHPDSDLTQDQVAMEFDVPDLYTGYADRMEFFCINPDTVTEAQDSLEYVKFNGSNAITGSLCNGLRLCGPNGEDCDIDSLVYSVSTSTRVRVKGIKTDGTKYCFAAFPAIRDEIEQLPTSDPTQDWIIRCITPEVKTPSIAQFPGFNANCGVMNNTISVSWNQPSGGIYSAYKVFWRRIKGNQNFTYTDATAAVANGSINNPDASPYSSSAALTPDTTSFTITDLRPGTRYKVGILTQTTGVPKYSEFNTSIKDCVTAMPKYKFEEWTRIFAIGPKVDGRFPNRRDYINGTAVRSVNIVSYVYEALNNDGIPYELTIDPNGDVDPDGIYRKPPGSYSGSYDPSGFGDDFDGASGQLGDATGVVFGASNSGIISLAWKDVTLDFLGAEYKDCQVNSGDTTANTYCYKNEGVGTQTLPTMKAGRRYGYKVYRSDDNRLSWVDVTRPVGASDSATGANLIYAKDYSYYKRPEQGATTERMAFFTDYSVKAMKTDPTANARARIYWYRIVPWFDNQPISLQSSQSVLVNAPNEIKVILPPNNMALMHRWMANRQACYELGRDGQIDKTSNYTCEYNGFGSAPKGFPWSRTNGVFDLGGNMLIDRFELGCNVTRGDVDASPVDEGNSWYDRNNVSYPGWESQLKDFMGYASSADGNDNTSKPFRGCTGSRNQDISAVLPNQAFPLDASTDYRKYITGDCFGRGEASMSTADCSSNPDAADYYSWSYPGVFYPHPWGTQGNQSLPCDTGTPTQPTTSDVYMSQTFRKNWVIQSEYAAVLHQQERGDGRKYINPQGPAGGVTNWTSHSASWGKPNTCWINLASIGSDNKWTARWIPAGDLDLIKGSNTHSTMSQIKDNTQVFNATTFKAPAGAFINDARFGDNTKIARVMASNNAKLAPISNVSISTAQNFCSSFEVEVGFSNNGTNFLTLTLPKAKSLLGRRDMVSASAWPDAANNGYASNLNYNIANITSLEQGNLPGYCSDAGNQMGPVDPIHGQKITSNSVRRSYPTVTPPLGSKNGPSPYIGGSNQNDEPSFNSGLCISKYGIQDIIGNHEEFTTDRLFCDYGADRLFFGRYEGGQGYEFESARMPDYDGNDEEIIWLNAKVIQETPGGDVELVNGTSMKGKMWASIAQSSGYCSIVDDVDPGAGYAAQVSRFRNVEDNFINIFNPDGTLNTNMVKRSNSIVQSNIDKLRNGDGYFLSFGSSTPAPLFQRSNSLSISRTGYTWEQGMALGPYFNPIVGLPMSCPNATCSQSTDNFISSTAYFMDHVDAPKPPVTPDIPRYPAGNSQISNIGISETTYQGGSTSFGIDFTIPENRRGAEEVVYEIRIKLDGTVIRSKTDKRTWIQNTFPGGYAEAGTQYFSKLRFDLYRGASLAFMHGGGTNTNMSGRYSMSTIPGEWDPPGYTGNYNGIRCGVMVE